MSYATITSKCPACGNSIEIENRWTPGGVNDYGGYILQCIKCSHIFALHVCRDINDSRVVSGAKQIDQYDDELKTKKKSSKSMGFLPNKRFERDAPTAGFAACFRATQCARHT